MPRPKIDGLFDSRVKIWRPSVTRDPLRVEQTSYAPAVIVGAVINRNNTATAQQPGGMTRVGTLRWYGRPDIDVRARDVCEVIEGPDVRGTWEVDGDPTHPRNHHTQVDCVEWHGVLPSEEVPS